MKRNPCARAPRASALSGNCRLCRVLGRTIRRHLDSCVGRGTTNESRCFYYQCPSALLTPLRRLGPIPNCLTPALRNHRFFKRVCFWCPQTTFTTPIRKTAPLRHHPVLAGHTAWVRSAKSPTAFAALTTPIEKRRLCVTTPCSPGTQLGFDPQNSQPRSPPVTTPIEKQRLCVTAPCSAGHTRLGFDPQNRQLRSPPITTPIQKRGFASPPRARRAQHLAFPPTPVTPDANIFHAA